MIVAWWNWQPWWWSKEEREVRTVLRKIAQQRVVGFAADGEDVKVNEVVVDRTNGPMLKTCQLRGWAEPDGGEVKDPDVILTRID